MWTTNITDRYYHSLTKKIKKEMQYAVGDSANCTAL